MFAKRLLQKAIHHHQQGDVQHGKFKAMDFDPHIQIHFGIPNTASILAIDPIQQLLAIGTLDGRIKVVGKHNIQALLISPNQMPYKNLEFLQNQGYVIGVLNDNHIEVWNLESRCMTCSLQWESNITAFSVISGSTYMFVGDEHGMVFVLKYAAEDENLVKMPYHISPDYISEKAGVSFPNDQSIIGVLPQPSHFGNRILIAYQYGLFVLWDVLEAKVIVVKGDKDLHIKDHLSDSPSESATNPFQDAQEHMFEKEITALCWASSAGSMLAVGYIDGDILLWNIPRDASPARKEAGVSCDDVVKLQLSSAEKRLPIIFLSWGESSNSHSSCGGQLFVYGGCEIGSEEVITVVSLQWSPGMEMLKSVRRVDFSLIGSFADMITLSSLDTVTKTQFDGLFVLTRPGKLQFYSTEILYGLERKSSVSGVESPEVIPTADPQMTVAQLILQPSNGNISIWLSEMASVYSKLSPADGRKWPLTGGVLREVTSTKENPQKTIYIVGYHDGSVRIWDATNPNFALVSIIEGQVPGIENDGSNVSVEKLDFCASTMNLAVGTHSGEVRVYSLKNDAETSKLHWVKHSERIVYDVPFHKGPQCRALFSLVNSPVQSLNFSASGAKLAVGFESNHVAVLDMISLSVLFVTDSGASSNPRVISVILKTLHDSHGSTEGPKNFKQSGEELLFILTQDAKVIVVNSMTGSPISSRSLHLKDHTAISMYVLDGSRFMSSSSSSEHHEQPNEVVNILDESKQDDSPKLGELKNPVDLSVDGESLQDSFVLVCSESTLRLYHTKSIIQGDDKPTSKAKLPTTCSWTSLYKIDDKVVGVILVYHSAVIEVRMFPDLELLAESSLISVSRWNVRPNMKLACSTDSGQICLANGGELVFISLSYSDIETRFLESLPLLHDKIVVAAADAAISISTKQKKQAPPSGLIGDIVKGFKKEKSNYANNNLPASNFIQLGEIFSSPVAHDSSVTALDDQEDKELDIDDIEIDEPVMLASTSIHQEKFVKGKPTKSERERLFEGDTVDVKPKMRTPEEIMAAYKGTEYASAAAERARNKLLERQEKLERISQRTEDLRYEAENFSSMANELVKQMERKKKWWKI